MRTLVTGFNAFGHLEANPSQLLVERLAEMAKGPDHFHVEVLPTEYERAGERIAGLIRELRPDRIVCFGVASGISAIHFERIALNLDDADAEDNTGERRRGKTILEGAPLAYRSTLPIEEWSARLNRHGIPAAISNHAGAFVCNHIFFRARHQVEKLRLPASCGFIHLPLITESIPMVPQKPFYFTLGILISAARLCLNLEI